MARLESKTTQTNLENELGKINERNKRVEADKAWETSNTRRLVISIFIYALAFLVFYSINAPQPEVNALIPAIGFVLSTMSFPFFKEWWMKRIYER